MLLSQGVSASTLLTFWEGKTGEVVCGEERPGPWSPAAVGREAVFDPENLLVQGCLGDGRVTSHPLAQESSESVPDNGDFLEYLGGGNQGRLL